MRKQEKALTELEPLEIASEAAQGGVAEEFLQDPAASAAGESSADARELSGAAGAVSRAEFEQLKAERDQVVDRIARLQAEFDNARKRAEREKVEFRDYATGSVVEQFLPVMDNFELALKSDGSADQLRSGVALIVKQMEDVLKQMQVVPVPAVGEAFDPRMHEALGSVERDDLPDQHVAEEIRRGYKLRERLLRPALVRVVHNPKQTSE
ncbi:MAG TPA: nucleotide exchange factor GrpE [Terracidiphilus sp.]|nr:nucleotide exchange factor GrpE [Terracidiphilus sp.]HUX27506.1 nucleotide exchange factor GrpE [Terracidiphilus sp.]